MDILLVKDILVKCIKEKIGIEISDCDYNCSLLSSKWSIPTEDFLHLIIEWEDNYNLPVSKILTEHDCSVFTINNLSLAIVEYRNC